MRLGQNPAKSVETVIKPERITVAVLNCIPLLSGFHAGLLQVLKACLDSIHSSADMPFDLLVFDNGSCAEVRQYLAKEHEDGRIQYLFLSEKNIGKGGAWNVILSGAPGELIAYTDGDVLFYPGWLSKSVKLMETFPRVGMVTARPFRTGPPLYSNTLAWAESNPEVTVEHGSFIPWETFLEMDLGLGQSEKEIRDRYQSTEDIRLTYRGESAFTGASHWQFLAHKETLAQFLPFQMNRPMGQVKMLDQNVNDAGFLRLMTTEPLVLHMGNSLPENLKPASRQLSAKPRSRLLDIAPLRRILLWIYHTIFRWYFGSK